MAYINENEVLFSPNVTMFGEGVSNINATQGDTDTAVNIAHSGNGAKGEYSMAQGRYTVAGGYASVAEGYGGIAGDGEEKPDYYEHSHDTDDANTLEGYFTHVEGNGCWAKGVGSHAEGYRTRAYSQYTHAEGFETTANGRYSHVEGRETKTVNDALCAHAEGYKTGVSGKYGHAEGYSTKAIGKASHASGYGTEARGEAQTVVGKYNKDNNNALFIVGDGADEDNRNNAFEVISNGNKTAIKVGNTEITEEQLNSLLALLKPNDSPSLILYANWDGYTDNDGDNIPIIDGYGNYPMTIYYAVNRDIENDELSENLDYAPYEYTGDNCRAIVSVPVGGYVSVAVPDGSGWAELDTATGCTCIEQRGDYHIDGEGYAVYKITDIDKIAEVAFEYGE